MREYLAEVKVNAMLEYMQAYQAIESQQAWFKPEYLVAVACAATIGVVYVALTFDPKKEQKKKMLRQRKTGIEEKID